MSATPVPPTSIEKVRGFPSVAGGAQLGWLSMRTTATAANPKRVQQLRAKKLPPATKSVARPSRWGNPFEVHTTITSPDGQATFGVDHQLAVDLYRRYLEHRLTTEPDWLDPLVGYNVACYCATDVACHADLILDALRIRLLARTPGELVDVELGEWLAEARQ